MDQSAAVRQVAQELNDGNRSGRSARLGRLMGSSIATVRSWGAAGNSEERKRSMNPTAKRLMFTLLALHRDGYDLDALRAKARRLEREFLGEDE